MADGTTPPQTAGPFFSLGLAWLDRSNLTAGDLEGERVTIRGRVLDGDGQPVPDAVLEIWQADSSGKYPLPEDVHAKETVIPFLGFGRIPTNCHGQFQFTTVLPGSVPGPQGTEQAPHLNVSLFMRGLLKRLVTRIYFPNEPQNNSDPILGLVPPDRRPTLIARPSEEQPGILVWDVHLQGTHETVFFDC